MYKVLDIESLPANKSHTSDLSSSPMARPSNTEWNERARTVKKSLSAIFLPLPDAVTQFSWWKWLSVWLFSSTVVYVVTCFVEVSTFDVGYASFVSSTFRSKWDEN